MISETMYELGSRRSSIRELFEYGKRAAAEVGPKNVYDFSLGNPSTPPPAAVTEAAVADSDVIYVPTDNTVANNTGIIDNICRPAGIPVIAGEAGVCAGCGVATLSISYYDLGYATGKMAAKILKGEAKISEMPIEYAPQFTSKYNAEICGELGLTPPSDAYVAIGG